MSMGFEGFEPIFGEPKVECASPQDSLPLFPLLFHAHAPDHSHLQIHITDFHSNTWEAVRSVVQLEDMRDNIGIGSSWLGFVEYVTASIKSEELKLVLEGHSNSDEKERTRQLTKVISDEKERSESMQSQLELYSNRRKLQKMNATDKADVSALSNNGLQNSPDKQTARGAGSTKVANRVVPTYRRAKVRGVLLQDTEDDKDK